MHFLDRKNYGQYKPQQYGPLSYVQSCVKRNAESLGIDPSSISFVCPFWCKDPVPVNIITGVNPSINNYTALTVNNDSIHIDSYGYLTWTDQYYLSSPSGDPEGTAFCVFKLTNAPDTNSRSIFDAGAGSTDGYLLSTQYVSEGNFNVSLTYGTTNRWIAAGDLLNKTTALSIDYPGDYSTGKIFKNGGLIGNPTTGQVNSSSGKWLRIGYHNTTYGAYADIYLLIIIEKRIPDEVHERLAHTPYALIVDNPPTKYFFIESNPLSNDFSVDNVSGQSSIENISIEQQSGDLSIENVSCQSSAENIVIEQNGGDLSLSDISSDSSIDNISLEQVGEFSINDQSSASSIDSIDLSQSGGDLQIDDISSVSSIDNVELNQTGNFEIADVSSQSSIESILIEQSGGEFAIDSVSSQSYVENIGIEQNGGTFEIDDVSSTVTVENIVLQEPTGFTDAQMKWIDQRIIMWINALGSFIICMMMNAPPF